MNVLVLHPGDMGSTVAKAIQDNGHTVYWCSEGRSDTTKNRANNLSLPDLVSVKNAADKIDVIISICMGGGVIPNALDAARSYFKGIFVDLNYVGGQNEMADLSLILERGSIRYVEGAIYGWPMSSPVKGERTVYLGGPTSDPSDIRVIAELIQGDIFNVSILNASAKSFKEQRTSSETASSVPHVDWGFGVVEFPDIAKEIDDSFVDEWLERRRKVEPNDYVVNEDGMYVSRGGYLFTERQAKEVPERFMNLSPDSGPDEDRAFHAYLEQAMLWCIQGYTGIYPECKDAVWWGAEGHVAAYGPGSYMGIHHDTAVGTGSNGENPGFLSVSGSLIISDRCVGGELYFKQLNKGFAPKRGSAYLYPATYMGAHSVSPIESGLRISYLEFFGYGSKFGKSRRV